MLVCGYLYGYTHGYLKRTLRISGLGLSNFNLQDPSLNVIITYLVPTYLTVTNHNDNIMEKKKKLTRIKPIIFVKPQGTFK